MCESAGIGRVARIAEWGEFQRADECGELRVVADRDHQGPVGGIEKLIGHQIGMRVPPARGIASRDEGILRHVHQRADGRVVECHAHSTVFGGNGGTRGELRAGADEGGEELAQERGIKNGEKIWVESIRGKLWAVAMVAKRMKPMQIRGKTVHQVGLPWQFGWLTPQDGGDAANLLSASVGEPNSSIPETKAFMVNVRKA